MHDVSSFCYIGSIVAGCVGYWIPKFVGPAVALLSLGILLTGR